MDGTMGTSRGEGIGAVGTVGKSEGNIEGGVILLGYFWSRSQDLALVGHDARGGRPALRGWAVMFKDGQ